MTGRLLRVAVVGGSTLLGRELLAELGNSPASAWDLQVFEEGQDAEGQLTSAGEEALVVHALDKTSFHALDLVFFAGTPEQTREYLTAALEADAAVIDLTGAAQGETGFLLKSPWLRNRLRSDLTTLGLVVPHAVAQLLAFILERLQELPCQPNIVATVMEPASQAGAAGIDELHQQTVGLLSFQQVPQQVFGKQVAFNLQGDLGEQSQVHLGDVRDRIYRELASLIESKAVHFALLQAPTFHGYLISAHLQFAPAVRIADVERALLGGLLVTNRDIAPSNQAAIQSGEVLFSLETDPGHQDACWLLMAADNLRLTARSAVQLGLELTALRPDSHVQ